VNVASQRAAAGTAPARVVAITGASAGIGRATALRLGRDGASLVLSARRTDELARVAAEIEAAGGHALPLVADVTSEADMSNLVERAVEQFGGLDVMVCNAGFGIAGSVDQVLTNVRNWLMGILAGLATVFATLGGVRYAAANGDPGEIERAKAAFRSAGWGYVLAALAPLLISILRGLVGA